jgi:hypothetical protein
VGWLAIITEEAFEPSSDMINTQLITPASLMKQLASLLGTKSNQLILAQVFASAQSIVFERSTLPQQGIELFR